MQYELYVDSLFLVNFVMNLYLLALVNRSAYGTATPGRLLIGAAAGGLGGLLPFMIAAPAPVKIALGAAVSTVGMLLAAFPVRSFRMFMKLLEKLVIYSFFMGGAMLFVIRLMPGFKKYLTGIFGIMGMGGVCFLFMSRTGRKNEDEECLCLAHLICGGRRVTAGALVDSGNSLTEPISRKPVCIVTAGVMESIAKDLPEGVRAVPYHSIGKSLGILEGRLLPELRIERNGITRTFFQVWIAVSPQGISEREDAEAESVKMIINPMLFSERRRGKPRKRQNERKYDT